MMLDVDWDDAILKKISVRIDGHPTSISIEPVFFTLLKKHAEDQNQSFSALVRFIDSQRPIAVNLSAALRIYALQCLKNEAEKIQ